MISKGKTGKTIAIKEGDSGVYVDSSVKKIKKQAERLFEDARGSHDWEHTLRVCRLCEKIGPIEGADMVVLMAAAYLHDIGRRFQDGSEGEICHAAKGAELTRAIIELLDLSESQKENIVHCVRAHLFSESLTPQTIEAKVLFDADKIDAIGAVGVARAYLFAGEIGARLHNIGNNIEGTKPYSVDDTGYREYKIKLSKIKDRILTTEGRRIAEARHDFMESFFKRFIEEYEGEK